MRCDKQTGEVTQKALPEGSVTQLLWSGGSLFAFMTDEGIPDDSSAENVPSSRALQLDEELNTVREFDLTPYGASVYRAIACTSPMWRGARCIPTMTPRLSWLTVRR